MPKTIRVNTLIWQNQLLRLCPTYFKKHLICKEFGWNFLFQIFLEDLCLQPHRRCWPQLFSLHTFPVWFSPASAIQTIHCCGLEMLFPDAPSWFGTSVGPLIHSQPLAEHPGMSIRTCYSVHLAYPIYSSLWETWCLDVLLIHF